MGVTKRKQAGGDVYRINFMFEGQQVFETAGTDKRAAERLQAQRVREVADGTYKRGRSAASRPTLDSYAQGFFRTRDNRSAEHDERRYRLHIAPRLGKRRLDTIRPPDVAHWVAQLVSAGDLSAKSIRNAHGVLSVILGQARFEGIVSDNAAKGLPRGALPTTGKRAAKPYSRAELAVALGSTKVPSDVRMLIAMMGLGGLREGEAAGRRWSDLNTHSKPLWCLHVHDQYDGQPLKGARGDYTAERWVPVHPLLQTMLMEWYATGFDRVCGRKPRDEDLIAPLPGSLDARTENQAGKAVDKALRAAGIPKIPGRRCHSLRRSFVSLTRTAGAREDVIERITHNAAGSIVDRYTWMGWEPLCQAVGTLSVVPTDELLVDSLQHEPGEGSAQGSDPLAGLRG